MLARVTTFALQGVDARRVTVEVDIRGGLPSFTIVGLGDRAVREARERVHAAIRTRARRSPTSASRSTSRRRTCARRGRGSTSRSPAACWPRRVRSRPTASTRFAVFGELALAARSGRRAARWPSPRGAPREELDGIVIALRADR